MIKEIWQDLQAAKNIIVMCSRIHLRNVLLYQTNI